MHNRPYGKSSGWAALLVIPFVYLLIWLFNAYRMGRIDRRHYRLYSIGTGILLAAGMIATLLLSR